MSRWAWIRCAWLVSFGLLSCTGSITGPPDGERQSGGGGEPGTGSNPGGKQDGLVDPDAILDSELCQSPKPGRAPLRRLSHFEYKNTLIDLLGKPAEVAEATSSFVSENESLGFRNNADFLAVPTLVAQNYMDAAERLSEAVVADTELMDCGDAASADCAATFIAEFGAKAFRRPLETDEAARYQAIYDQAAADYDHDTGMRWVVFAMLQSQSFLYRVEVGEAAADGSTARPTQYEMANRLSYLLWQSMPDDGLFAAAEAGELSSPEQIRAQAERMLEDPKAERVFEFYSQWLDIDELPAMDRDANVFAEIPGNLPDLLRQETQAFVTSLLGDGGGTFAELLTAPYSFVNDELAQHYGISGTFGAAFERVDLPGRAGILTQGGVLGVNDKPTRTSIVLRGLKMRTDFLCQLVPAPPNDVELDLEGLGDDLTQREKLALHREEPACAGCHELIDPLGVVFEAFDAVGRPRSEDESGAPVVTESEIGSTIDADGAVSGPTDLAAAFANSEQVRQCFTTQSFRFFYGRDLEDVDACSNAQLMKAFTESGYSLREVLLALTQTDAFLYRPLSEN